MSDVKALADAGNLEVPGENELTLIGYTNDDAEFTGTQTIIVINVKPVGPGHLLGVMPGVIMLLLE